MQVSKPSYHQAEDGGEPRSDWLTLVSTSSPPPPPANHHPHPRPLPLLLLDRRGPGPPIRACYSLHSVSPTQATLALLSLPMPSPTHFPSLLYMYGRKDCNCGRLSRFGWPSPLLRRHGRPAAVVPLVLELLDCACSRSRRWKPRTPLSTSRAAFLLSPEDPRARARNLARTENTFYRRRHSKHAARANKDPNGGQGTGIHTRGSEGNTGN